MFKSRSRRTKSRGNATKSDSVVAFLLEVYFYRYHDIVQHRERVHACIAVNMTIRYARGSRGNYERLDVYPPNLQIHRIPSPWNKLENFLRNRCKRRYPYRAGSKEGKNYAVTSGTEHTWNFACKIQRKQNVYTVFPALQTKIVRLFFVESVLHHND